jgi:CRISPR-associated protein Csh2
MINAIPTNRTRSKIGQTPRVYLRVELVDKDIILKDLREYLDVNYKTDNKYAVRTIKDFSLDIGKLNDYLKKHEDSN